MGKEKWCSDQTAELLKKYKNADLSLIICRNDKDVQHLDDATKFYFDLVGKKVDPNTDLLCKEAKGFKELCNSIKRRGNKIDDVLKTLYIQALAVIFSNIDYDPNKPKINPHIRKNIRNYSLDRDLHGVLYNNAVDFELPAYVFGFLYHMLLDKDYTKHVLYKNIKQMRDIVESLRKNIPTNIWIKDTQFGDGTDLMLDSKSKFKADYDVYTMAVTDLLFNIRF